MREISKKKPIANTAWQEALHFWQHAWNVHMYGYIRKILKLVKDTMDK